ncbi:MAG: ComEC/Rec2 family competence protein [Actinomycetota bacterium]
MGAVAALGALVVGIGVGERIGPSPATLALGVGVMALAACVLVAGRTRVVVASCALALLGMATMTRALEGAAVHPLRSAIELGEDVEVRGTLVTDPGGSRFRAEALVRIDGHNRVVVARADGTAANRLRVLAAGDRVELAGRIAPLGGDRFDARYRWRHAIGRIDAAHVRDFASPRNGLYWSANALRTVAARGMRPLSPTARALLAGLLFGDTRAVPEPVTDAYRGAGLSHLLAVSGANVAFALALVGPLLRRLPLGARSVVALGTVLGFAAVTRFEPSVLRASALAAVGVLSALAGRPTARLRALVLAVIALLLVDPFLVHSVGFQLSAAASAGIALLAAPFAARLRGPASIREPLAVSLAAQVGVTPLLLATFDRVPLVTPLTNLAAAPAADLLGAFGLPSTLLSGLVPPLGAVLQPANAALVGWVTGCAHAGAAFGLQINGRGALGAVAVGALATLARRGRPVASTR